MVFQSYALYPHMNIEKNMSYSLRLKRSAPEAIKQSIAGVAETLGLGHLLERMPRQLSGGQRQRVAMGRAIVRNPKVFFLFDEPLSNLDAALRVHMRAEIRKLHHRLHATSVYVTHDQIEAMTMADHVVVLRAGQVEQQGAPLALYEKPANKFVAGFIGSPAMNFIEGVVGPDARCVTFGGAARQQLELGRALPPGQPVWIGLRPEHLRLEGEGQSVQGVIDSVESTGSMTFIALNVDGAPQPVLVAHPARSRPLRAMCSSCISRPSKSMCSTRRRNWRCNFAAAFFTRSIRPRSKRFDRLDQYFSLESIMKISDGNWLIKDGLNVMYAVQIHSVDVTEQGLLVYAAPRDVASRAGQLDTGLITLRFFFAAGRRDWRAHQPL